MKRFSLLLILALLSGCAHVTPPPSEANQSAKAASKPSPVPSRAHRSEPEVSVAPTPAPKAMPTPKATPVPEPTPAPAPKPTSKATPAPTPQEPVAGANTEAVRPEQPRTPKPAPSVKVAKVVPEPAVPETSQEPAVEPVLPAFVERNPGGPESAEKQRYRQAREKAAGDHHIAELRKAMETTGDGEAYKTAAHAYVKALFSKIRKLEPQLTESLRKKEEAYQRRIDAGKALAD